MTYKNAQEVLAEMRSAAQLDTKAYWAAIAQAELLDAIVQGSGYGLEGYGTDSYGEGAAARTTTA